MNETIPCILVVDDEPAVVALLAYNLGKAHYRVVTAATGYAALDAVRQHNPDLILLDLMLPGVDGLDVCREIRRSSRVPIIMITACDDEVDRVVGLELGADDYIGKPFSVRELMARVKAVLRRVQPVVLPAQAALTGPHGLSLDLEKREARLGEILLELTRLEFDLLYSLCLNAGKVMSRERLLEEVWGYAYIGDARTVDSMVKRLRASLKKAGAPDDPIESVRGIGYKFHREPAP